MERRRLLDINGIPFADDLIFYAPLTQGDTTDHISGQDIHIRHAGALTWDNAEGAYKFNGSYAEFYSQFYWSNLSLGIDVTSANTVEYTMFAKVKIVSANTDIYYCRFLPSAGRTDGSGRYTGSPLYQGSSFYFSSYISSHWYEFAGSNANNVANNYIDKTLARTTTIGYQVSGLPASDINKYVSIFPTYNVSGANSGVAYVKDVRFYNRALTAAEIAQL